MRLGRYHIGLRDFLLALLTLSVLSAMLGLVLYLNSARVRVKMKARLEAELSKIIKREFRLGEVGFQLPLSLSVGGLAIADRDSLSRGQMVSIKRVGVAVDPFRSLWQRRIIVARIEVDGLQANLKQDVQGHWNFEDLLATDTSRPKKTGGRKNFPPLQIPMLALSRASIRIQQPKAEQLIDSLRLRASLRTGGEHLELKIKDFGFCEMKSRLCLSKSRGVFKIAADSMRLQDFEAWVGKSRIEAGLWLADADKSFEISHCRLHLDLSDVGGFLAAAPGSYQGRIEIEASAQGSLNSPQGRLRLSGGALRIDQIKVEKLEALAELKGDLVKLSELFLGSGRGSLEARAEMDYRKRSYSAELSLKKIDLGQMMASPQGKLATDINGHLRVEGQGLDPKTIRARASLFLFRSLFSDIPLDTLDFKASVTGQAVEIENFHLRSGQAAMDIRGDIYPRAISLELETDEIELSQFGPLVGLKDLSGRLRFNGLISGETKNPDIIATFRLKEAKGAGVSCEYFDGSMSMKSLRSSPVGDGKFSATGISVAGQSIDRVALLTELRGLDWGGFSMVISKDSLTEANLVGRVEMKPKNLTLVLSKVFYAYGPQTIANSHPVKVTMEGSRIVLDHTRFIIGRGTVDLSGQYGPGQNFSSTISVRNLDSRRMVELLNLSKTVHGYLDLDLKAQGTLAEPMFDLQLTLNTLRFEQLTADRVDMSLDYCQGRLNLSRLNIQRYGQISEINASVPLNLGLGKNMSQLPPGPIEGQVILRDIGTWAFFPMADLLSVWEGRVDVNVKIFGTTSQPLFSGEATVNNGKMVLRPLGMYLHSVQAHAHFNADSIVIDNISALTENNGTVQIKRGEILLEKFMPTTMNIVVVTERSPVRNIPFIEANVNSHIQIGGTVNYPRITGEVTVNSALISMPFAPAEEPPPPEGEVKPLDMSLNISGNQGIWLRNKDADIELAIENLNVRLQQNLLFLSGRLSTIQGVYRFLDRSFDLTSGQLTFTNAVLIDPQLNLTAQTTIARVEGEESKQYLITLKVGGTALQPKLSFSSDPSMPEGDILAMLGAGMRADELSNIDLGSQASRGLDYALSIATGRVQRHTGLDMLKVKTMTGAEKGAQVTIGKYVAKKVYVSYTQGFSTNLSNEFKAEYLFGPRSALFAQKDEKGNYNLGVRMRFKY